MSATEAAGARPPGLAGVAETLRVAAGRAAAWLLARGWRVHVALFVTALTLMAAGQATLPPGDRDEARFAQATKQMLETGDYLDIRFQGETRYKKPVGIYWLQAASAGAFGGAEAPIWAYRLPSLIGAALAVALTAWAFAPLVGREAAALGAALLAVSPLLHVEAHIAKTDAALLAVTVLALGAMARALFDAAPSRLWPVVLWVAAGLGVLLKGPIIAIPLAGVALGVAVADRGARRLGRLRPLWGLGIVAAIAAPWLVAITVASDGAFWAESVGKDLLGKVARGQESHGAPPGFHTLVFFAAFWPWAALAPWLAPAIWPRRGAPQIAALIGCVAAVWLVFEITPTKLPHYGLPAYPALAALIGAALLTRFDDPAPRPWVRWLGVAGFAIPAVALTVALLAGPWVIEGAPTAGGLLCGLIAAAVLAAAGLALARWRLRAFAPAAGVGAAVVLAGMFQFTLPALHTGFVGPRLAALAAPHRCPDRPVAVAGFGEPSAVFALGTDTIVTGGRGAAAALADGRAGLAWVEARAQDAFMQAAGPVEPLAQAAGFNYANGRPVTLTLFAGPTRACP